MNKEEFVQAFTELGAEDQVAILDELGREEGKPSAKLPECCASMMENMPEGMAEMMPKMMATMMQGMKAGKAGDDAEGEGKSAGCGCGG